MAADAANHVASVLQRLTASQLQPHDRTLLERLQSSLQSSTMQATQAETDAGRRMREQLAAQQVDAVAWARTADPSSPPAPRAVPSEYQQVPFGSRHPHGNYGELLVEIQRLRRQLEEESLSQPAPSPPPSAGLPLIRRRPLLIAVDPAAPEPVEPEPTPVVTGHAAPTERPRRRLIKKRISDDSVPPVGGAGSG